MVFLSEARPERLPRAATDTSSSSAPLTPEQIAALPHDNAGPRLNTIIWVLVGVSALFLGLRLYCKLRWHTRLWWDDYVLIGSWTFITIESALLTYTTTLGYGLHVWDIPFDINLINNMVLTSSVAGTFSVTAAIWSKTSFALTLLRLTGGWMKTVIWFIIISMNVAMGLSALFTWVHCTPIQKSWSPFMDGTCWPPTVLINYHIFSAAYSALMDISLALLPWKLIWGLQMGKNEKIGVAVAMSCGIFAGVTAIVKTSKLPAMLSTDIYDGVDLSIWGTAESCVTIIAASIPILRVLVRQVGSSAKRYYATGGEDLTYGQGSTKHPRTRNQANTVIVTAQRSPPTHQTRDDCSDKSILEGRASPGKILQTHQIAIEYQDHKDGESIEYEMGHMPPA